MLFLAKNNRFSFNWVFDELLVVFPVSLALLVFELDGARRGFFLTPHSGEGGSDPYPVTG